MCRNRMIGSTRPGPDHDLSFFFRYAAPRERSERTKWFVVMSEFAPIFIYLVISLLVSLILLGLLLLNSNIQSQTTRKLTLFHADPLEILISILIWLGIPVIAYCADGDAAGPSHEGGDDHQIPILKAPSPGGPVDILLIPDSPSPPSLSPQDLLPSIEEGDKAATQVRTDLSQKPSFFIPEIPPYRGGKVQPSKILKIH